MILYIISAISFSIAFYLLIDIWLHPSPKKEKRSYSEQKEKNMSGLRYPEQEEGVTGVPNPPSYRANTYDNVCGTKQELLDHINNLVGDNGLALPKGHGILEQLTKTEESEKKHGTILLCVKKEDGRTWMETIHVFVKKEAA